MRESMRGLIDIVTENSGSTLYLAPNRQISVSWSDQHGHLENNPNGQFVFQDSSGDWRMAVSGSFRQAATAAARTYQKQKGTDFVRLTVEKALISA